MKKWFFLLVLSVNSAELVAQDLYDISTITLIKIEFEESNWDEIMDLHYANNSGERLVGTCTINGVTYSQVGISFERSDTYQSERLKNPLDIKLDHVLEQKFQGHTVLNLSNGDKDPSLVREVLSYEIGRKYMDMPLANYAKVFINDAYYGLFSNVENIDGDYFERRLFIDDDNTHFKGTPKELTENGASLNFLGFDSNAYFDFYELSSKSDKGWEQLIDFTLELQTDLDSLTYHLDIDRTLWMLAFNSALVNLDSYSGAFKRNYDLIRDEEKRFFPIANDLNQSIGGFRSANFGDAEASLSELAELDVFIHSESVDYPLISSLFAIPRYRRMYVAHLKTILEENLSDGSYLTRGTEIQEYISIEVENEPNGFYTITQFEENLNESVLGGSILGIEELVEARVSYLESIPEFIALEPTISAINENPEVLMPYGTVSITATVTDADFVQLGYRNDRRNSFQKLEMFDDGAHGDGAADDGVFGISVEVEAEDIQYYIYAENENAGKFSPERAQHEFYDLIIDAPIVINEIMPQNFMIVADDQEDFDDWVELYNPSSASIDISGYHLSDAPLDNPLKWKFPSETSIAPNSYLIVWLDEDTLDDGLHANFKLSSKGESISLSDEDGFEISRVKFPEMNATTTYGRYPNGVGPFIRMFPTFEAENNFTSLSFDENTINNKTFTFYPNPSDKSVTVLFNSVNNEEIFIYDLVGNLKYTSTIPSETQIDVSQWSLGIYIIEIPGLNVAKKLIKQ